MKVRELLEKKGRPVVTIRSDKTVDDAVGLMAAEKASALIVLEKDHPVGIFAERDVLRAYLKNKSIAFAEIKLADAMTNKLIQAGPEDKVVAATQMMLKADIRHLPVIDDDRIIGMLTISDLVEHRLDALDAELRHLKDYIADLHDAGHD
jgi:IMP dehydrogenase